jgi:quinol monooxygenase YgiN
MTRFLILLLSTIILTTASASAQVRRGTGLLAHNHGQVLFHAKTVILTVKPAYREQFLQATAALQAKSAHAVGCLNYHYYEDPASRNNFLLLSEWSSSAAMGGYYRQPYVVDYFGQLPTWLAEPATVQLFETLKGQMTTIPVKP